MRALLARLPSSVVLVGLGLGVLGLSSYGYLSVAGQALGPVAFAPLAVLWALVNGVGLGLFAPLEQEVARGRAAAGAAGASGQDALSRAVRLGLVLVLASATACAVAVAPLADALLGGRRELVAVLALSLAALAVAYLVRGLLAGSGRYRRYAAQLAVDGVLRVAGAAALAVAGVDEPLGYGLVLALAPLVAVVATTGAPAALLGGLRLGARHAGPPLVWLLLASLLAQLLANAGPMAVELLAGPGEEAAAGVLLAAVVVARVPLFAFAAVQAVFLPALSRAVGAGDPAAFAARWRTTLLGTAALGAAGVVAMGVAGPELVRLLFGSAFDVDRADAVVLALSGAAAMAATTAAHASLSLGADARSAAGWAAGVAALVAACALPLDLATRVSVALLVGAAVAAGAQAVAAMDALRRWRAALAAGVPA